VKSDVLGFVKPYLDLDSDYGTRLSPRQYLSLQIYTCTRTEEAARLVTSSHQYLYINRSPTILFEYVIQSMHLVSNSIHSDLVTATAADNSQRTARDTINHIWPT